MVFKTTCVDRRKLLREGTFFFTRTALFPPLDERHTRDKARGLRTTSERHIGELGVRCLSALNRGQDSRQQALAKAPRGACVLLLWRGGWEGLRRRWECGV